MKFYISKYFDTDNTEAIYSDITTGEKTWNEEYLFIFTKTDSGWRCSYFTDITFGFYSTMW